MLTQVYNDMSIAKFDGMSTDAKPVDCQNGSEFNEIDTGDKYLFDADSQQWYRVPNGGGGGGGGTSDYDDLQSKPSINGSVLRGNKTSAQLGLQSAITSDEKLDSVLIDDTNSVNKFVTQEEKTAWNGKQSEIRDLEAIRSGASAGATAVQPEELTSAINSLDVSSVGGSGKYIKAISESDGKINATSGSIDNSPASGSSNPVSSGGVYAAISALDASKAENTDLAQEVISRQNVDAKHDSALAELIDGGAKNLLQMTHAAGSITRYGVTCTWDQDAGTMTLTGSHAQGTEAAIFEFYSGNAADQRVLPVGEYHLSGVPAGGSTSTYRASLTGISGGVDTGNGAAFTLTEPKYAAYRILISGDCDFADGLTFEPMICLQAAWDISHDFVQFAPSNAELYAMIRNGSASVNSMQQTSQPTAIPNDTGTA